jgi:hypothetical protein
MQYDPANLRTYAAAILALGFLAMFIYSIGHRGRGIIFSFILLAGAGTLGWFEYSYQQEQTTFTKAIQNAYGNPNLYLHCQRLVDSLGDTVGADGRMEEANPGLVWVDNASCSTAFSWARGSKTNTSLDQAKALYTMNAEINQVAGAAGNNCAPIQSLSPFVQQLGASETEAKAIASLYFTNSGDPAVAGCAVF